MKNNEENYISKFREKFPAFDYVSGYVTYDSRIMIKCKICGHIQERHANSKNTMKCDNCIKTERENKSKTKEIEVHNRARKRNEYSNSICAICGKTFLKSGSNQKYCSNICKAKAKSKRVIHTKTCKECGSTFKTDHDKTEYCSTKCRNRYRRKKVRISKDKRLTLNGKADYSISLKKLYQRDKGICHICGEKCNPKDYIEKNSVFIAGERYPSIDHVYPISKGGTHTWDNVKLAHRGCNAVKNDKIIFEEHSGQLRLA